VLSLTYNRSSPIIFNTYQAYLKGSYERLAEDMERARREKYVFAAKLVSVFNRQHSGWCTLPTLAESFLALAYVHKSCKRVCGSML
jgi:hypothetical protein